MAGKLVVFKSVRSSLDKPFFLLTEAQKEELKNNPGAGAVVGERLYANGLTKIRAVFFPTVESFNEWNASQLIKNLAASRSAHNAQNGIVETMTVTDVADFNL